LELEDGDGCDAAVWPPVPTVETEGAVVVAPDLPAVDLDRLGPVQSVSTQYRPQNMS
jgi:hypothetical protein